MITIPQDTEDYLDPAHQDSQKLKGNVTYDPTGLDEPESIPFNPGEPKKKKKYTTIEVIPDDTRRTKRGLF